MKYKTLFLIIFLTLTTNARDDNNISSSKEISVLGDEKQNSIPQKSQLILPIEQLQSVIIELRSDNQKLTDQLTSALNRLETLEMLASQNLKAPPLYKKYIPADKILLTSVIFATVQFYQMYCFTNNITLALGAFVSNLYACYSTLKIIRDSASVAGNTPFINKIG